MRTISIVESARHPWDAVVIGAGPAGALAARQLARGGKSVLLVEAKRFPRDKVCGGCLSACALAALEKVGLHNIAEKSGGVPISEYEFHAGRRSLRLSPGRAIAIVRRDFDRELVGAAIEAGCHFLPETRASLQPNHVHDGQARQLCLEQPVHRRHALLRTKMVLVADGLGHSALSRTDEFRWVTRRNSRIGISAVIPEVGVDLPPGRLRMIIGSAGYVGTVRASAGAVNVAAAIDAAHLRRGCTPAVVMQRLLSEAQLAPLPALGDACWRGTGALSQAAVRVAGQRVLLIGDTASYVEPFTGEGMAWAFASALAAVPVALEGIEAWSSRLEQQWTRIHRRTIVDRQWLCRAFSAVLRSPGLTERVLAWGDTFPSAAACVTNRLNPPVLAGS